MTARFAAIASACAACAGFLLSLPASAASPGDPAAMPAAEDDSEPAFVPGQLAVDLRDNASEADVAALSAEYGVTLHASSAYSARTDKLEVGEVDPAREASVLAALAADVRVERAEPMGLYRALFVPNDPLYKEKQWHLTRVGAESAWNYACGRGVTVAVVDTGIACFDKGPFSRGTDLAGTRCQGGWNFVADTSEAADDQGHGTHVAGTIAQTTNNGVGAAGLAYCATLMPIKVLTSQGFGTTANVAEGIRFAADSGAQVINLSLGGPIRSSILRSAVDHALSLGVIVVAAAGNSGRGVGYPAAYPGVLAVSATDATDALAAFSSRGPQVFIAAPGVAVTQQTICNGGREKCELFGTYNGTSMASPHVAGAVAILESLGVTRESAIRQALTTSARPRPDPALFGAGLLDVGAAARNVFFAHLALRALALLGVAAWVRRRIRQRGGKGVRSFEAAFLALATGVGIFPFAPLLGAFVQGGRFQLAAVLAMHPFGEWDLVLFGPGVHRWMLLSSALPALVWSALAFENRRIRPMIGGVALGSAALVLQMAWSADVAFVGGPFLARVALLSSALMCVWIARHALDARP